MMAPSETTRPAPGASMAAMAAVLAGVLHLRQALRIVWPAPAYPHARAAGFPGMRKARAGILGATGKTGCHLPTKNKKKMEENT